MATKNKHFPRAFHKNNPSKNKRISHFEPLESRQMLSTTLPAAPPPGSSRLTGQLIGTAGSYQNKGNTIANAIDGNTNTFFDAPSGTVGWLGYNLGTPETITQVQYVPRSGYASRMVGGVFQGSDTPDFSADITNLFTITTSPPSTYTAQKITSTAAFQYVRYLAPATSSGNVAEIEFDGYTPGIVITPPPPPLPATPTSLSASNTSPTDVHLTWQEPAGNTVNSFTIFRQGPNDSTFISIGSTQGTVSTFDDLSVLTATNYAYEIVANNVAGASTPATPISITTLPAPTNPWTDSDIGAVGLAGSASLNTNGSVTVSGSGTDIWNTADAFNFDYQSFTGNGSIITQVTAQSNPSSWAKSGIMIRENTSVDSRYVLLALTPGNGVTLQARTATHVTPSVSLSAAGKTGIWLELVRNGSTFTGYSSADGKTWSLVGSVNISMVNNVVAGLAVTAHNNTKICTATFSNITLAPTGSEASAWSVAATNPTARWESETFTYNNLMYVFGGYIDRVLDATTECDVYNPATNTWSYLTTMPTGALTHSAVTLVGDTVYFAGGNLGTAANPHAAIASAAVLSYNITTGQWGSIANLPAPVSSGGMVYTNNELIYYGGINANNTVDQSATYTLSLTTPNASWMTAASMPDARNHLGYATINGIAYAIGGMHLYKQTTGNDAEVDAYNPVTNTWTQVASLPFAWGGVHDTTIVVNNKIVVLGGQTNGGYDGIYLNAIQEYDPVANTWNNVGSLPEANQGESVAYINNLLIVADGTVDNQGGWAQNQVWIDKEILL